MTEERIEIELKEIEDDIRNKYTYEAESISEYIAFHETINGFTWLLKSFYSSANELRSREIRIERIFARYLTQNRVSLDKIAKQGTPHIDAHASWTKTADSLKKVWYNELSYLQPSLPQYLNVDYRGVQANLEVSQNRMLFLSWKVTQSYYAVYHSFRCICDSLGVNYDPKEHHAPMRAFKSTKLIPSTKTFLFFPFDLGYTPAQPAFIPSTPPIPTYHRYQYAGYPRNRRITSASLIRRVWIGLGRGTVNWPTARRRNERFMIPDYLYNFRTWANYVNIDNLVDLKSRGYKAYMDLDLYLLTFFYSSFAEICTLATYGEEKFIELAKDFHERFVSQDASLMTPSSPWPMSVRFKVYKQVGLISQGAWEPERNPDPNTISLEDLGDVTAGPPPRMC